MHIHTAAEHCEQPARIPGPCIQHPLSRRHVPVGAVLKTLQAEFARARCSRCNRDRPAKQRESSAFSCHWPDAGTRRRRRRVRPTSAAPPAAVWPGQLTSLPPDGRWRRRSRRHPRRHPRRRRRRQQQLLLRHRFRQRLQRWRWVGGGGGGCGGAHHICLLAQTVLAAAPRLGRVSGR